MQGLQQGYGPAIPVARKITLRGYQAKAKGGVREKYRHKVRRVLLVMPTGAGKTVVFSDIAYDVAQNGKRVLILAHRIELLEQCGRKLDENGVDFGYLNPKYTAKKYANVQVGTMQTVVNRLESIGHYDLIIIDEAHRSMSKTYRKIVDFFKLALLLGVTATPCRGDGKPLGDMYEDMEIGPTIMQLIKEGALVMPDTYAPLQQLDLQGLKTVNGDYDRVALAKKIDKVGITGSAVEHYHTICPGAKAVAFCVSVEHAKHVAADFRAAGYLFEHIDGTMSDLDTVDPETKQIKIDPKTEMPMRGRSSILNDLRDGKIHGITSVDLVTEGLDIPAIECAIMLRPTKSEGLYLQMAGRILRPFPGKNRAIILDHAALTITHGPVTWDRDWIIDVEEYKKRQRAKKKEKPIAMDVCQKCFHMHEPVPACPRCGHVNKIRGREPELLEGGLQKLTEEDAIIIKKLRKKEEQAAKTLEELQKIERDRGYKSRHPVLDKDKAVAGWAEHKFAARNGKRDGLI